MEMEKDSEIKQVVGEAMFGLLVECPPCGYEIWMNQPPYSEKAVKCNHAYVCILFCGEKFLISSIRFGG